MARMNLSSGVYLGYDGEANALRTNNDQNYQVWFDRPDRQHGSLREESIKAAQAIRAGTDKEIVVLYSGGLDSEWTMESFRCAGIKVTALRVVYANGGNDHDMFWANRYLKRTNHESVIDYQLDLADWYRSDAQKELALKTQTPELAYTAQFRALLETNNSNRVFITSYDEPLLVADDADKSQRKWNVVYSERHYSVVKLFEQYDIDGCSNWSRQSSSLFASFVTQPQWMALANNLYNPLVWNSEMIKVPMFQFAFPNLEARTKYTGFEQSLGFVVEGGKAWRQHLSATTGMTFMQDYSEPIESVWAKLGLNYHG